MPQLDYHHKRATLGSSPLSAGRRFLFAALLDHADDRGETEVSIDTLVEWTGMHRRTVIRYINDLDAAGLVTVKRSIGHVHRYILPLVDPSAYADTHPSPWADRYLSTTRRRTRRRKRKKVSPDPSPQRSPYGDTKLKLKKKKMKGVAAAARGNSRGDDPEPNRRHQGEFVPGSGQLRGMDELPLRDEDTDQTARAQLNRARAGLRTRPTP